MDFEHDNLEFERLVGGKTSSYPPKYSSSGEHLLFITGNVVNVYSTISCELVRKLECPSEDPLIDFEFELQNDNILIACNNSGIIFSWEWKTGVLKNSLQIPSICHKKFVVTNFKLLNLYGKSDLAHAFVCFKITNDKINWRVLNRESNCFILVPCSLKLTTKKPLVVVDNKNFSNLVIAQNHYIFFVDYKKWIYVRLKNSWNVPVTALQMHTSEECVATGDECGKIILWREFYNQQDYKTSLYHWHHTKITSICFTATGASFYSSGEESVLVKWNVERPELRQFIPRTSAEIRHIVVSPDNTRIAICLVDNSIQFYGTENALHQIVQEFTYVADNNTEHGKYPVGLRLNPRNNTLVLNGRVGSLQFFSTYTKSLLYNVNIVNQNLLSKERDRILYNIHVTKAAFNIDWMATGEVFNDEEHFPELRLKFWKYQEDTQNYALNTNIELPHEGGFKAIEFSNYYQVENLICGTVGEDNIIKIWCLDDSDNIYKKGKTWYYIAQTSYKQLPVDSISFSQDGSLLAAGYGNTLCIYKSDNLKLKAALTGTNGIDGCITKVKIKIPANNVNGTKSKLPEKRERIMQLFTNMLEKDEDTLISELQNAVNERKPLQKNAKKYVEHLDEQQKISLFKKIVQMHELNLFQKVLLFQKFCIACKVHPEMNTKFAECLGKLLAKNKIEDKLHSQTLRLNLRQRFKAKYRLQLYRKQQYEYDEKITKHLVPLLRLLSLGKKGKDKRATEKSFKQIYPKKVLPPNPTMAEISHVQFAAGEYAHLVVVCTERRVLIWNLLTLRIHAVLKLSVKYLTFDAQTNLVAVVTQNNELHLFQPNVPLPIYQRRNLPDVYGIAWIPRRYPKQKSINVDWQAHSTLYFLNEEQGIIYLSSPQKESDVPAPITFNNPATDSISYTTFGTYAAKSVTDKQTTLRQNGPLVLANSDKTATKALIDMSIHTMPPMSLLCEDFIKSMVKCSDAKASNNNYNSSNTDNDVLTTRLNGFTNGFESHSDTEADENDEIKEGNNSMTNGPSTSFNGVPKKIRKDLLNKTEELKRKQQHSLGTTSMPSTVNELEEEENNLRRMARQTINLDF